MERYSFEKAYSEAEKMRKKVENKEARDYSEAEKIIEREKNLPDYEKKFGHIAEDIIRESVGKKGVIIGKVDKGTRFEDCDQKVDFWLQLLSPEDLEELGMNPKSFEHLNLKEPLGIQFTTDPMKYKTKKEFLRKRNFIAQKTERKDAEIKWFGRANVVVVLADHAKMLGYWKKMELEGKKAEEAASNEFIRDFLAKVFIEFREANPAKYIQLMKFAGMFAKKSKKSN